MRDKIRAADVLSVLRVVAGDHSLVHVLLDPCERDAARLASHINGLGLHITRRIGVSDLYRLAPDRATLGRASH